MPEIDEGNGYITTGSISGDTITGGTTVKISTFTIEHEFEKDLVIIPIPVSRGNWPSRGGSGSSSTKLLDLIRIKEVFTVKGVLADEDSESGLTKLNNIRKIARDGGNFTLIWGKSTASPSTQQSYTVNVLRYNITEGAGAYVNPEEDPTIRPERGYDITIQLIQGVNI